MGLGVMVETVSPSKMKTRVRFEFFKNGGVEISIKYVSSYPSDARLLRPFIQIEGDNARPSVQERIYNMVPDVATSTRHNDCFHV